MPVEAGAGAREVPIETGAVAREVPIEAGALTRDGCERAAIEAGANGLFGERVDSETRAREPLIEKKE